MAQREEVVSAHRSFESGLLICLLPPDPSKHHMPRRVNQWVDHHLATLRRVGVPTETGVIGYSFGGVVAVELTRSLRAEGVDVDYCGLIDTLRPILKPLSNREFVWHHLAEAALIDEPTKRRKYLRRKTLALLHRQFPRLGKIVIKVAQRTGRLREIGDANPGWKPTDPLMISIHTAYLNYRGASVDFPVCIYETEDSSQRTLRAALGWVGHLERGFRITRISGGHFSLFDDEHLPGLVRAMEADLEAVARRPETQ